MEMDCNLKNKISSFFRQKTDDVLHAYVIPLRKSIIFCVLVLRAFCVREKGV